jgi:hypothetical protein
MRNSLTTKQALACVMVCQNYAAQGFYLNNVSHDEFDANISLACSDIRIVIENIALMFQYTQGRGYRFPCYYGTNRNWADAQNNFDNL